MKAIVLTAERVAKLNATVSNALGALYDGGYVDIFVIHPAYWRAIAPLLTEDEKAAIRPLE